MKTILAKTNPAFKRAQPLPMIFNLQPPSAGGPARRCSDFTPTPNDLRRQMIDLALCVNSLSQSAGLPAVRSLN